jgi:hypothetical protein
MERDGLRLTDHYRFEKGEVHGKKEKNGGQEEEVHVKTPDPPYNFETDIELFQALPLEAGYEFEAPFYDPGLSPPARYRFRVEGAAVIQGPDGREIDCWLVTGDYNHADRPKTRYWIAKRTQVLVREEVVVEGMGLLIKTLLPPEASDIPENLQN